MKWEKQKDFQTATFVFCNHLVVAYFNTDGQLLGSARNVLFYELPMAVIKLLEKRFPKMKPMVLIGHSMGGCISRLMLTDSSDKICQEVFGRRLDDVPATP